MSVDVKEVLAEMGRAVKGKLGVLPKHEEYHEGASAVVDGLRIGIGLDKVKNDDKPSVEELLKQPIERLREIASEIPDLTIDGKSLESGGDTMTEPLFGSLRTGILNELYEAENDYLERIKEKDARIEELEAELLKQKEKNEIIIQLDASSISKVVNKAISEVTNDLDKQNPGFIVYEGKTYRKTERDPQVGDVVIVTYFDDVAGTWIRRVQERGRISSDGFYLNSSINHETYFYNDDDKIAAVYAPFDEGTTYA